MNADIMKDPRVEPLTGIKPAAIDAAINNFVCPVCGIKVDPLKDFRDGISYCEWTISRMCQSCQDETFTEPPEPEY